MKRSEFNRLLVGLGVSAIFTKTLKAEEKVIKLGAMPKAKATSIIQIWMWGGASHIDTFDPKPDADSDYTGPLKKVIDTNVKGIKINASLPFLAGQADKYSLIRSMTHGINGHETASYVMQTGRKPDRLVYPSLGAVISLFKGYENGYKGIVPPYVVMSKGQGRFSESGFLGQSYKPFVTSGDPNKNPFEVEGVISKGITDKRQYSRRELLRSLDTLGEALKDNKEFQYFNKSEEEAYGIMFGEARNIFNLQKESSELRDLYGRNTFGQSCLMARRLVENKVPYITINYDGWDTHKQHFQIMNRKLPEFDQGLAMLLKDLADKKLLDNTIVWCVGEFGRSPKVLWDAPWNGGRSHHGACFSALVAGGGFIGGQVVGSTNANATEVIDRPVYPVDLLGSIYELSGINPDGKLPNRSGLETNVLPEPIGGRLNEIMKKDI